MISPKLRNVAPYIDCLPKDIKDELKKAKRVQRGAKSRKNENRILTKLINQPISTRTYKVVKLDETI